MQIRKIDVTQEMASCNPVRYFTTNLRDFQICLIYQQLFSAFINPSINRVLRMCKFLLKCDFLNLVSILYIRKTSYSTFTENYWFILKFINDVV
jgi:hypothetical protein